MNNKSNNYNNKINWQRALFTTQNKSQVSLFEKVEMWLPNKCMGLNILAITDNCNPIRPGIKGAASHVLESALLLLQQAKYFIKALPVTDSS